MQMGNSNLRGLSRNIKSVIRDLRGLTMKKHLILVSLALCFVPIVSIRGSDSPSIDQLQQRLFGVSTLYGVKEVYPQVQLEIIEEGTEELRSSSKIGSLVRKDLKEQIIQALEEADIKVAEKFDTTSADSPLSLNITVMAKVTGQTSSPVYTAFVCTEALQPITLSRDVNIRSLTRTWPMIPMGLITRNILLLNSQTIETSIKKEVARQTNSFTGDFVAANPKPVSRNAVDVDVASLRKTLFEEGPKNRYGLRIKPEDSCLIAIERLCESGSAEAVTTLREFLTHNRMDRKLKQHALVALGQIATEPATDAIGEFEAWSRKRFEEPQVFLFGLQESAIDHFAPYHVGPLAQTTDEKNRTWSLLPLNRYGQVDLWLTSLIEKDLGSEPIFLDVPGMPQPRRISETTWDIKCQLQIKGDSLRIVCDNKTYESRISDHLKDADKDGLPDIVETRLLTDPHNPDSDKDGLPDGIDSNPLTPKHSKTDDITEIRQAVFSVLFATCSSQNAMVIVDREDFANQEYYGFGGVVLRAPKSRDGFVNVTSINIKYQSDDAATATISDWEGSEAASVHEAKLKKITGKWIVVDFRLTLIS